MLVPEKQIGSSYGDAIMAATGVGILGNLSDSTEWINYSQRIVPRTKNKARYDSQYEIYRSLYQNTSHLMKELSHIQQEEPDL